MCSSSKGHVWWWIAALSVLVEILVFTASQKVNVPSGDERNVALNRPCNQSSDFDPNKGLCNMALNGRHGDYSGDGDCIHTQLDEQNSSFSVNLGPNIYIHKIIIVGRPSFNHRNGNMHVYLDGENFTTFIQNDSRHEYTFDSREVRKVEIVTLKRFGIQGDQNTGVLNICEVYVYACLSNRYGLNCEKICDSRCKSLNVTCDRLTGSCLVCNPGKWGDDCLNDCGEGCKDGVCNKTNGHCTCTSTELVPPLCRDCNLGKWGKNCENDCGVGCEGETCNKADGSCECQPGWGGTKCDGRPCECGEECTTSRKYIFADIPRKVNVAIGKPSKASTIKKIDNDDSCLANDGYLSTSELTTCMSTAEGDPAPFWEVDLGGNYEIAGINIDFDDDKMNLKSGISILLDGKEIFVTNDETTDPAYIPNNRNRNWTGQVLKLQRKGPRVDPLMICEVEVFNCLPGFFGYECEGICEKPVCDNARFCSRIDGSCPKTDEVKETSDCSPLILVAGYVVGFLIISLFIFAAKVIPYKKKSKPKAVKKEAEGDKEEKKTEGEGSGSGGDKVEELEAEGDKVEQEAEAEGEVQNEANSEIEERETQV